jgi:hypothetical protein
MLPFLRYLSLHAVASNSDYLYLYFFLEMLHNKYCYVPISTTIVTSTMLLFQRTNTPVSSSYIYSQMLGILLNLFLFINQNDHHQTNISFSLSSSLSSTNSSSSLSSKLRYCCFVTFVLKHFIHPSRHEASYHS